MNKKTISLNSAILFFIINHPITFKYTYLQTILIIIYTKKVQIFYFFYDYIFNHVYLGEGIKIKHSLYAKINLLLYF